ncbi:DUF4240 domain-containing protein [Streptomyces zhihengii]|uniref:DUF4240 domain-containing protein n=1 Tax=Streptomyces zhihengii TaxID=1818004 RepID=UPI0036AA2768
MDSEAFWRVLDAARDSHQALDEAVVDHLSALRAEEILAFERRFACLRDAVHRWDVWAAAYLIGGGCSDDRFSDFTAGLVALGRDWYERVAACPDALAEHPAVRRAAADGDESVVFDEDFHFVAPTAYERLTGDASVFWEDWAAFACARAATEAEAGDGMGEPFDFTDDEEMRRRLPRLAALYLGAGPA